LSSLIKLTNVTKIYRSDEKIFHALQSVNLEFYQSEMAAIMGASGSGKSTLMNIIGLLDREITGDYFFSGEKVSCLKPDDLSRLRNQKIGFVFQSFFLLPHMNVLQNVMLPLFYRQEEKKSAEKKALVLLEKVGMKSFCHQKPHQLSGGQQQRVAIARALVCNPEIILADEPTGSLDARTGQAIMALLRDLHQTEKRTIILVTHDEKVSQWCQRTITIREGRVL